MRYRYFSPTQVLTDNSDTPRIIYKLNKRGHQAQRLSDQNNPRRAAQQLLDDIANTHDSSTDQALVELLLRAGAGIEELMIFNDYLLGEISTITARLDRVESALARQRSH